MPRSAFHFTCACGQWLVQAGPTDAPLWCVAPREAATYQQGRPTGHDVYHADGHLVAAGRCRDYAGAPAGAAPQEYPPLLGL